MKRIKAIKQLNIHRLITVVILMTLSFCTIVPPIAIALEQMPTQVLESVKFTELQSGDRVAVVNANQNNEYIAMTQEKEWEPIKTQRLEEKFLLTVDHREVNGALVLQKGAVIIPLSDMNHYEFFRILIDNDSNWMKKDTKDDETKDDDEVTEVDETKDDDEVTEVDEKKDDNEVVEVDETKEVPEIPDKIDSKKEIKEVIEVDGVNETPKIIDKIDSDKEVNQTEMITTNASDKKINDSIDFINIRKFFKQQNSQGRNQDGIEKDPFLPLSKTVTKIDGTSNRYKLELTATGKKENYEQKVPLDILFVVDTTGSMKWNMTDDKRAQLNSYESTYSRWYCLKHSVKNFIESVEEGDNQYAMITFAEGSQGDLKTPVSWTKNGSDIFSWLDAKRTYRSLGGGTNYQAPFRYIKEQQTSLLRSPKTRLNAAKVVIFLSDGSPSFYYTDDNPRDYKTKEDNENYYHNAVQKGTEAIKTLNDVDAFYAIGVSQAMDGADWGSDLSGREYTGYETMSMLIKNCPVNKKAFYIAPTKEELKESMEDISRKIQSFTVSNAVICDTLSEDVEPIPDTSLTIEITDEQNHIIHSKKGTLQDGVELDLKNGHTLSLDYLPESKKLTAKFSEDYALNPKWTYKVSLEITPTEKALQDYGKNAYKQTDQADADTGTFALKKGIFTNKNDEAYFEYHYGIKWYRQFYKKPVIQIPKIETTTVTVEKRWVDDQASDRPEYVEVELQDVNGYKIEEDAYHQPIKNPIRLSQDNDWHAGWENVAKEIAYQVVELDIPDDYEMTVTQVTREAKEHGEEDFEKAINEVIESAMEEAIEEESKESIEEAVEEDIEETIEKAIDKVDFNPSLSHESVEKHFIITNTKKIEMIYHLPKTGRMFGEIGYWVLGSAMIFVALDLLKKRFSIPF